LGGAAARDATAPSVASAPRTTTKATTQLQPAQRVWSPVAKNASGDTKRHATESTAAGDSPCRPVASPGEAWASLEPLAPPALTAAVAQNARGDRKPTRQSSAANRFPPDDPSQERPSLSARRRRLQ